MHKRIYMALLLAAALLATPSTAHANVIQRKALTATVRLQEWQSKPISGLVSAHLYSEGVEMNQRLVGHCAASYAGGGIFAWVKAQPCTADGRSTFVVRYLSVSSAERLTVVLAQTGHPETRRPPARTASRCLISRIRPQVLRWSFLPAS